MADADIVVMDDVLSALDATMAAHVFSACLLGLLGRKTVLLVTHQLSILAHPRVGGILVLSADGSAPAFGTLAELSVRGVDLLSPRGLLASPTAAAGGGASGTTLGAIAAMDTGPAIDVAVEADNALAATKLPVLAAGDVVAAQETSRRGLIQWNVVVAYVRAWGGDVTLSLLLVMFCVSQATGAASSWWLSVWTAPADAPCVFANKSDAYYAIGFWAIVAASVLCSVVRVVLSVQGSLRASRSLHARMVSTVLRLPLSFFDRVRARQACRALAHTPSLRTRAVDRHP